MRTILRLLAALLLVAAGIFWTIKGANRGWTKTNILHETPDPVTGLVGKTYEKGYIPGVDFLAEAALVAGVLVGASFAVKKKTL